MSIACNGTPVDITGWPRRAGTLIRLLATTPERRRLRDEVEELLWPETTPEAAASNLRSLLHRVRRSFGPELPPPFVLARGWILLNPACAWEIDLDRFEDLAHCAGEDVALLQEAADLARAEPLPEDRYEDWAIPIRARVQERWRQICLRLARLERVWGTREQAVQWFERVLERDPLDEEALQGLLGALGEAGRGAEARRRYQDFAQRLQTELDAAPSADTLALVESLPVDAPAVTAAPVVPSYPLPIAGVLVGRAPVVRGLHAALPAGDTSGGRPQLVLLAGEAGMGKTRLLAEAARLAQEAGILCLAGGCYDQEGRLPYGPIHDALLDFLRGQPDPVLRAHLAGLPDLARVIPEVRGMASAGQEESQQTRDGDAETQRLCLFAALSQLLQRIAARQGLVLLVDDLQWADEATLHLLHFLLRQPRLDRLLIVGAYRTEEVRDTSELGKLLQALHGERTLQEVRLTSLSEADIGLLLADRLGGPIDEGLVRKLHARSMGNPFFALQMLQLLQEEGHVLWDQTEWHLRSGRAVGLPPMVRETIARRLRQLRADDREALTLGAILGREFAYAAIAGLWERSERSLFTALDAAYAARLLDETEDGYVFHHPLQWEVVYQQVPAPRRMLLHERAALTLEQMYGNRVGEHAEQLAWHCVAAGRRQVDRAVRYLILAGDQAERAYAHSRAERYYRSALELLKDSGEHPRHRAVLEKLGEVLRTVARYDDALEIWKQLADLCQEAGDLEGEARAGARIGRAQYLRGALDEAIDRMQPLIRRLEQQAACPALAELYLVLASSLSLTGQYTEAVAAAEGSAQLARLLGDARRLAEAVTIHGDSLAILGCREEASQLLDEGIHLAESAGDADTLMGTLFAASFAALDAGEVERSREYAARSLDVAERLGDPAGIAWTLGAVSEHAFRVGEWSMARAHRERAADTVQTLGRSIRSAHPLLGLARLSLLEGKWEDAQRQAQQGIEIARRVENHVAVQIGEYALAHLDLWRGHAEPAAERLESLVREPQYRWMYGCGMWLLAWAYLQMGEERETERAVSLSISYASERDLRLERSDALRIRGLLRGRQGRWEEAVHCVEESLLLARRMTCPYSEAAALYAYGVMEDQRGRREQAQDRLRAALASFQRLSAHPYIGLTEQALVRISRG